MMESDGQCVQCSIGEQKTRKYTCTTDRTILGDDLRSKLCCSGKSESVSVSNNNSSIHYDQNGYAGAVMPVIHQQQETVIHSYNENLAQTNDLIQQKQQLLFTRTQHRDRNESRSTKHTKFRSYSKFDIREQSFIGWTSTSTLPIWIFAKAGFFYKGFADIVACFECGIVHRRWQKDDDPVKIHIMLQPECPYIMNLAGEGIRSCEQLQTFESCGENIEMNDVSTEQNNVVITSSSSSSVESTTDSRLQCKVCLSNPLQITIQPCGHFAMCEPCFTRLKYETNKCPICRVPIKNAIRTYV
ncbi:death-associated inhibitor of apoptosis 2-like [Mytilus trossulus]|uniref:death-associated inhibitor of apoptosis 2-like n=1 Tax=Mytilus trossulus TaxID=6551 RepID=UPI003006209A